MLQHLRGFGWVPLGLAAGLFSGGLALSTGAVAAPAPIEDTRQVGILAGLLQPIITDGANLQLEVAYGRFVFDYSHGWSLEIPTAGAAAEQGLALHLPYSTGLGIGYRFTETLDLRFEPKLHKFEVNFDEGPQVGERLTTYQTVTLGVGAYHRWRPFGATNGVAKGLMVASSFRIWPNVWSSLDGGKLSYQNENTGQTQEHQTQNIGIANTPFLVNVSIGYVFDF